MNKHIDIRKHYARELIVDGILKNGFQSQKTIMLTYLQ